MDGRENGLEETSHISLFSISLFDEFQAFYKLTVRFCDNLPTLRTFQVFSVLHISIWKRVIEIIIQMDPIERQISGCKRSRRSVE